jgi:DNA replication protein DnaC
MTRNEHPQSNHTDTNGKRPSLAVFLNHLKSHLKSNRDPSQPDLKLDDMKELVNAAESLSKDVDDLLVCVTFGDYEVTEEKAANRPSQAEVAKQVEDFAFDLTQRVKTGRGGLVLFGRPGTGKDHLAVAAGYAAIFQHGYSVRWIHGLDLFAKARKIISTNGDEEHFIREFVKPKILILSDPIPPKGDASQYNADVLMRIVDRRYRSRKPTWLTLNVIDGEEAERRLASPIVDRVRHGSLCLECNWPSYRKPFSQVA